mmetsp:Transcript_53376/g.104395  ORF Transcript_53376/g.104395 Transcript_53376/m.104395 type:complete len:256 (-) Transcript_53376:79-846(-)
MGEGRGGGDVGGQGERRDVAESGLELLNENIGGDVEHSHVEDAAVVVHALHLQPVHEGLQSELLEKSSLGGSHLEALLDDVHWLDDLNLTLGDLRSNTQSLEERSLGRVETAGSSRDMHVHGGDGSLPRCCGHFVGRHCLTHLVDVGNAEHKTDVELDLVDQVLVLRVLLQLVPQATAHHRVLSEQKDGLASQGKAHLRHLLGPDIVAGHHQDLGVGLDEVGKLLEVDVLLLSLCELRHLAGKREGSLYSRYRGD